MAERPQGDPPTDSLTTLMRPAHAHRMGARPTRGVFPHAVGRRRGRRRPEERDLNAAEPNGGIL